MSKDKSGTATQAGTLTGGGKSEDGKLSGQALERSAELRVHVFKKRRREDAEKSTSQAGELDEESKAMADVISPPLNVKSLLRVASEENSILGACISCMEVNIDGFGYTLDEVIPHGVDRESIADEIGAEREAIDDFLKYINPDVTFSKLRKQIRRDLESTGFAGWEFVRDGSGDLVELNWIPARYLRVTKQDKKSTEYTYKVVTGGKITERKSRKKFRRYVWFSQGRAEVYYKEFGDPRKISAKTGKPEEGLPETEEATELYFFKNIDVGTVYPLPRWLGALISVLGARYAEELNYAYFENGQFIPFLILVSGGQLTEGSVKKVEEIFSSTKGVSEAFNAIVLEAVPAGPSSEEDLFAEGRATGMKLDIKPLMALLENDALFLDYDKQTREKIRLTFRLPQILLGMSEDYNRATAEASLSVVNAQVFSPERDEFDGFMNRTIFALKGFKYHKFRSNAFKASDPLSQAKVLEILSNIGTMTPKAAVKFVEEILGEKIELPDEEYVNHPFLLVHTLTQMGLLGLGDIPAPEGHDGESEKSIAPGIGLMDNVTRNALIQLKRSLILRKIAEGE